MNKQGALNTLSQTSDFYSLTTEFNREKLDEVESARIYFKAGKNCDGYFTHEVNTAQTFDTNPCNPASKIRV